LLCTLNTLATLHIFFLFFIASGFLATRRFSVSLGLAEGSKLADFYALCTLFVSFFQICHRCIDQFNLRVSETLGEGNFEHHEEISKLE